MKNFDKIDAKILEALTLAISARTRRIRKEKKLIAVASEEQINMIMDDILSDAQNITNVKNFEDIKIDGKVISSKEAQTLDKVLKKNYGDIIELAKNYLKLESKKKFIDGLLRIYNDESQNLHNN